MVNKQNELTLEEYITIGNGLGISPNEVKFRLEQLQKKDPTANVKDLIYNQVMLNPDQWRLPDLSYLAKEATEGQEKNFNIEHLHRTFHTILGTVLEINNHMQQFDMIDKETRRKYHGILKDLQEGLQKCFFSAQEGTFESRADIVKQKPIYYPGDGDIAYTKNVWEK